MFRWEANSLKKSSSTTSVDSENLNWKCSSKAMHQRYQDCITLVFDFQENDFIIRWKTGATKKILWPPENENKRRLETSWNWLIASVRIAEVLDLEDDVLSRMICDWNSTSSFGTLNFTIDKAVDCEISFDIAG